MQRHSFGPRHVESQLLVPVSKRAQINLPQQPTKFSKSYHRFPYPFHIICQHQPTCCQCEALRTTPWGPHKSIPHGVQIATTEALNNSNISTCCCGTISLKFTLLQPVSVNCPIFAVLWLFCWFTRCGKARTRLPCFGVHVIVWTWYQIDNTQSHLVGKNKLQVKSVDLFKSST